MHSQFKSIISLNVTLITIQAKMCFKDDHNADLILSLAHASYSLHNRIDADVTFLAIIGRFWYHSDNIVHPY